ncbi:MAG: MerR family transcriptional regulator, partial [Chloroflexota bacterium]
EIAKLLDMKPGTIRLWSDKDHFRDYLSPTGAGGDGAHRDFTDDDLRVLYFVKQQKDVGRHTDDIKSSLASMQTRDVLYGLPLPGVRMEAEVAVVPAALVDETRRALLHEVGTLQNTVRELKDEIASKDAKFELERADRRAEHERLLREISTLESRLSRTETMLELYESGRLKPKGE